MTQRLNDVALEVMGLTAHRFENVFQKLILHTRIDHPREPGKWTPRQIIHHLTDYESLNYVRFYQMLIWDSPTLVMMDPDRMVEAGHYRDRKLENAISTFANQRQRTLELLRGLQPDQLVRTSIHQTLGEHDLCWWVERVAWHDGNHLAQLEASLETV
jgi:hypothetical protein